MYAYIHAWAHIHTITDRHAFPFLTGHSFFQLTAVLSTKIQTRAFLMMSMDHFIGWRVMAEFCINGLHIMTSLRKLSGMLAQWHGMWKRMENSRDGVPPHWNLTRCLHLWYTRVVCYLGQGTVFVSCASFLYWDGCLCVIYIDSHWNRGGLLFGFFFSAVVSLY